MPTPKESLEALRAGKVVRLSDKEMDEVMAYANTLPDAKPTELQTTLNIWHSTASVIDPEDDNKFLIFFPDEMKHPSFERAYKAFMGAKTQTIGDQLRKTLAKTLRIIYDQQPKTPKTEDGYVEKLHRDPDQRNRLVNEFSSMGLAEMAAKGMEALDAVKLDDNDLPTKGSDLIAYILHAVYQDGATEEEALAMLRSAKDCFTGEIRGIY